MNKHTKPQTQTPLAVIEAHIADLLLQRPQSVGGFIAQEHTLAELRAIHATLQAETNP